MGLVTKPLLEHMVLKNLLNILLNTGIPTHKHVGREEGRPSAVGGVPVPSLFFYCEEEAPFPLAGLLTEIHSNK